MSTAGQFSTKNPTIKRILKEAAELASSPSADYHAAPLETDLFEWHFTIRGPPAPSPFEGGIYHGRIVLPPAYPLKPPSFRFLTPSGRFEVNREICLSISGHHEESWQPAWGIRTALVAIRSFMDTDAKGQLGGMDANEAVRRKMAKESREWKCASCGRGNLEVMKEQEEAAAGEESQEEEVPEQLRLAFREDLAKGKPEGNRTGAETTSPASAPGITVTTPAAPQPPAVPATSNTQAPAPQLQQRRVHTAQQEDIPAWIDKAIIGIVFAIIAILWLRFFG